MAITRSFTDANKVVDYTPELLIVPQQWGTINQLGIFQEEGVEQYTVTFDEVAESGSLIIDRVRGERGSANTDYTRKTRAWPIPHFPFDEYISPSDVKGKRAYGSADREDTLAEVRARRLERLARNHAWTLEKARAVAITTGDFYAPGGTIAGNFYTEFGVTRKEIDFTFATGTTDIVGVAEGAIAQILDNAGGTNVSEIIALCGKTFFKNIISHSSTKQAYQYYQSTQEPLRQRLGGNLALHREFSHGGVRYIEMRDAFSGTTLIPDGDAYFLPLGSDAFQTYFAPANRFDMLGTIGERQYAFEVAAPDSSKITILSESNFLNAVRRPALVVRGFSSN